MLGLSELKQTRVYQEAKAEGQEELLILAVPALIKAGLTVEEIAVQLQVNVEMVRRVIQPSQN
jgi:predicted transposase YdaD